jgi:hypothetical protein
MIAYTVLRRRPNGEDMLDIEAISLSPGVALEKARKADLHRQAAVRKHPEYVIPLHPSMGAVKIKIERIAEDDSEKRRGF